MFVTNPFKARAVFFYFCMFHKLRLGYAGIHDDSRETDDSDISWQEFDNNSTTTNEQVILCANITVGLDSITCPNATIAILKVIKKVQEDSGDVDESDKDSIRDTLLAYCNGGEHCSGTPLGDIEDECGDDGTTSTYVEFRVEYLCIEDSEIFHICDDNLPMTVSEDILYVGSPVSEYPTWNCNVSLISTESRQWSAFLFDGGRDTRLDVYNENKLAFSTQQLTFPGLLTDRQIWGRKIFFNFTGTVYFLMAIKMEGLPASTTTVTQTSSTTTISPTSSVKDTGLSRTLPQPTKGQDKPMRNIYMGVGTGVAGLLLLLILLAVVILLFRKRRRTPKRPPVNRSLPSIPLGSLRRNHSTNNEDGRKHQCNGTDEDNTTKLRKFQEDSNYKNLNSDEPLYLPLEQVKRKRENNTSKIYAQLTPQVSAEQSKVKLRKGNHRKPKKKLGKRVKSRELGKLDNQSSSLRRQKDKPEIVNAKCESETIQAENIRTFKNNSPKVTKSYCGSTYRIPTPGTSSAYDYIDVLPDV